ncbi:hypothetical protein XENOCAPTIV_002641 [Xenoophorus captivus]|uniref:Midnolin n=1 Tax=Xenoophorus captivus TaxID=1517983 RepID=A0ABV0RV22_9TELE
MEDQWGEQSLAATYVDVTYCRGTGTMDVMQAIPSSPLTCGVLALFTRGDTLPPDKVHAASGCTCDRIRQTENRATRCKVERLQLLMQQKRLRRKARRDQRAPYQWLPNRKAGRSNSNSSMSSEGSLDLDFEDSVWKPDVKADLKSEFVMA